MKLGSERATATAKVVGVIVLVALAACLPIVTAALTTGTAAVGR